MIIHHSRLGSGFVKLPNETIRDERLSIAARGHLAYLLSQPPGWSTTADAESKRARAQRGKRGEGRDAMRRIYAELKDAGYIYYARKRDSSGTCSTEIHIADRPRSEAEWKATTDVRLTDVPETRMSVPPAEMPEGWPGDGETFSQVAPMYGSPGVGSPDVGSPVHRQAVRSYEALATEDLNGEPLQDDGEGGAVGDGADGHDQSQDQDHSRASLAASRELANPASPRLNDQPVADRARHDPFHDSGSTTDGHHARASDPAPAPRKCDYVGCPTPGKALGDGEQRHIGCRALDLRAKRAVAEAAAS